MKTVEATKTDLPSFETEWSKRVDSQSEAALDETNLAHQRVRQMLQSSSCDNTWRGFKEYDSPLAG